MNLLHRHGYIDILCDLAVIDQLDIEIVPRVIDVKHHLRRQDALDGHHVDRYFLSCSSQSDCQQDQV